MNLWDIETGAQPLDDLMAIMPEFEAPKNLVDPVKIAKAIAEKKADWIDRAALSAETGMVVAIGVIRGDADFEIIAHDDERRTIGEFWKLVGFTGVNDGAPWAGWNTHGFDLPFLIRRSWILNIAWPTWIRSDRYFDRTFIDLMQVYALGAKNAYFKLDEAAKAFGGTGKNGDGGEFARLWSGTAEDRAQAVDYLRNDLDMTRRVCNRILGREAA